MDPDTARRNLELLYRKRQGALRSLFPRLWQRITARVLGVTTVSDQKVRLVVLDLERLVERSQKEAVERLMAKLQSVAEPTEEDVPETVPDRLRADALALILKGWRDRGLAAKAEIHSLVERSDRRDAELSEVAESAVLVSKPAIFESLLGRRR